ncbi:MAG TPA: GTP-binding protein [Pseudonocardiaceae bacterium]|nr:GTP-binding protein [Pseudonocardiaceae bacterium]
MSVELIVVCGVHVPGVEAVVQRLRRQRRGTVVVHHDLREVTDGVVQRRMRWDSHTETITLELAHGCLSCALRVDVLPLLRSLARTPYLRRIVLHLDPVLGPDQVCWALRHVRVDGAPVCEDLDLRGVITVLDPGSWLEDATGAAQPSERGLAALPGDKRTLAQVVVGQAEFADLLIYGGTAEARLLARTDAVLSRLTPLARRLRLNDAGPELSLGELPLGARRGRWDGPFAALLRGQPPLHRERGVELVVFAGRHPFHPERLHEAIDVLLKGVVRSRGRVWLATRPEAVLWMESAGGGLHLGVAGDWLAAGDAAAWAAADPERVAMAALNWHHRWGDRRQELAVLTHAADPGEITAALRAALLTEAELAAGENTWRTYPDPFGVSHTDPCATPFDSTTGGSPAWRKNRA